MKKRIRAAALGLCLLLLLCAAPLDGRAATVYFTAANDTLLELSDDTMPFWSGSQLYVPVSAFSSGGLGISESYNSPKKTLTLRRSGFRLICNLSSGMTVDSDGNVYDFTALEKGGVLFLPINPVCRIFSLSCSTRSVPNGYLVRIRNESAVFSDEAFIANASAMLSSRYASYEAGKKGPETDTPQAPDPGSEEESGRVLYLGVTVSSAQAAEGWLDACSGTEHRATFFLTEAFFADGAAAETVRRILSEGHNLGLAVSGPGSGQELAALRGGNEALRRMACVKTRLASLSAASARAAAEEGYCPVGFDLSCAGETELSSAEISRLLSGNGTRLDLGDSLSEAAAWLLLRHADARGYTGQCFRETAY